MKKARTVTLALAYTVIGFGTPLAAQTIAADHDTVIAELVHFDSTSRLQLTRDHLIFSYTDLGVDNARHRVDSTTADYADAHMARLVRHSVVRAFRSIHAAFDLDDITAADASGRTVLIQFKLARGNDGRTDNQFDFDSGDAEAAQAFVAQVRTVAGLRR